MSVAELPQTASGWHRRVWTLSWPVVIANVTIPLVGLVDTAVMGRMPDPSYVGAVAVGATIFNALYWIFGFLRMGTTGLTAQALGARRPGDLAGVALRAATIALALGFAAIALQFPLGALVLRLFDASDPVEAFAATYFRIRIWGAPALLLHMVALGILFGLQRVRATLALSLLLNLSNVVLDVLFVIGFGWEVAGVAAATIISEWLAACAGVVLVVRALISTGWQRRLPADLWQRDRLSALFQVSGNLIVRSFFVQLPFFVFTLIGARFGDLVLAANAIIMQLLLAMAFMLDAFAHTAETLCGYAYGAGDRQALRRSMGYSLVWAIAGALVIALGYALAGDRLINTLTLLPEVRAAAAELLPWAVAAPLLAVLAFHFDGVFIGTTRTATLRNTMFCAAMLYLLILWLTLERYGNQGLWWAMMVFFGSRGLVLAALYPGIERALVRDTQALRSRF